VFRPLGSGRARKADVRIIAATNADLEEAVKSGKFRQDLYFRLNIIPFALPPLRERREDISLLARHFLNKHAAEPGQQEKDLAPDAMQKLLMYEWPGNVRELEHAIERAVVLSERPIIRSEDILLPRMETSAREGSFQEAKAQVVEQFERSYIERLLRAHRGNISRAAQAAQKNRRAFWQLIRKHRINVQSFKSLS
jgi:DNA-binding NtrC family response regulator